MSLHITCKLIRIWKSILHYSKSLWPSAGQITFYNVFLRFRKETDLVLNEMSFTIAAGEKIGCVGRTGVGKSSIFQALFRMVEIEPRMYFLILKDL